MQRMHERSTVGEERDTRASYAMTTKLGDKGIKNSVNNRLLASDITGSRVDRQATVDSAATEGDAAIPKTVTQTKVVVQQRIHL